MDNLRWRALIFVFGGPLANILLTLVVVVSAPQSALVGMLALYSAIIGFCNLIPFINVGFMSDGKRMLILLRNDAHGHRWLTLMRLNADIRNGVPIEDLSRDLMEQAISVCDESLDTIVSHAIAYASSWARGETEETAKYIETALQYSGYAPAVMRQALFADAAVFQGSRRKNARLAREWLSSISAMPPVPGVRLRIDAAILQAEGDYQAALSKVDEIEKIFMVQPASPQKDGSLKGLQRWHDVLKKEAKAQSGADSLQESRPFNVQEGAAQVP